MKEGFDKEISKAIKEHRYADADAETSEILKDRH
jgi:hypothetical protein